MTTVADVVAGLASSQIVDVVGDTGATLTDLTHDSREVGAGWGFACVTGEHVDGHEFAAGAVEAGATMLLVERRLNVDVAQVIVRDVRRSMGPAAAIVHGHPSRSLTVVGITGTNGKTTTAQMLGAILEGSGRRVEILGTLTGRLTTPEAPTLQRRLAGFVRDGVDAVVMEVSSHAMVFHRAAGVEFDAVVFTNLGRDHLDLHESKEAYFRAKASLFDPAYARLGVTNLDDRHGRLLADAAPIEIVGFGRDDASDVEIDVDRHAFTWRDRRVEVPIGGAFNVMNSLAALTAAVTIGIPADVAVQGIAGTGAVPGRFETVTDPDRHPFSVVVDYAHTPDGLEELLGAARAIAAGKRVIAVFGAAGDRDPDKRAPMGAAGARLADVAIVTSDNPRSEDPAAIVEQVVAGADPGDRHRVEAVVDRRAAISAALHRAEPGDVVVVAGKGHEATQTVGVEQRPFDDRVVARELLAELEATQGELS